MKIIHITQLHKLPFGIKPEPGYIESSVQSQFKVAHEIKKHPEYPVLVEGLNENVSEAASYPLYNVAKMIFPDGFPNSFLDLTKLQKDFLYEKGAVHTLFYLDDIKSIYKSIHKDASDIIDKKISDGGYEHIFLPREQEAIECAKEAAMGSSHNLEGATVFLVYGGGHDMKSHCDRENFEYEIIDTLPASAKEFTSASSDRELAKMTTARETIFSTKKVAVPEALQEALTDGGVDEYVKKGHVTLEQLISINEKTPYVIGALRCYNIRQGIYKHHIDIDQLCRLTAEQIDSLKHKFYDQALESKVGEYVKSNQNRL